MASIYRSPSIGNAVNIVVVKLLALEKAEVSTLSTIFPYFHNFCFNATHLCLKVPEEQFLVMI